MSDGVNQRPTNQVEFQRSMVREFNRLAENARLGRPVLFFEDAHSAKAFMSAIYGERSGANFVQDLERGVRQPYDAKTTQISDVGEFQVSRTPEGRNSYQLIFEENNSYARTEAVRLLNKAAECAETRANELSGPPCPTQERDTVSRSRGSDRGR